MLVTQQVILSPHKWQPQGCNAAFDSSHNCHATMDIVQTSKQALPLRRRAVGAKGMHCINSFETLLFAIWQGRHAACA